uniref:Uncharacterized protein n=1 Tax=Neospora caninum (strain Liverpool) TaxID=572307 RepID=A0A0F7U4U5_NEOCL|nr:TPA: hypothetical protein BN1204_006625 [Neospora caninum Liverpool]
MSRLAGVILCRFIATASFFSKAPIFPRGTKKMSSSRSGVFVLFDEKNHDGSGGVCSFSQTSNCINDAFRAKSPVDSVDLNQDMLRPQICPKCCKPMRRTEDCDRKTGDVGLRRNAEPEKTDFESMKDASWQIVDLEEACEGETKEKPFDSQCALDLTEWVVFA